MLAPLASSNAISQIAASRADSDVGSTVAKFGAIGAGAVVGGGLAFFPAAGAGVAFMDETAKMLGAWTGVMALGVGLGAAAGYGIYKAFAD